MHTGRMAVSEKMQASEDGGWHLQVWLRIEVERQAQSLRAGFRDHRNQQPELLAGDLFFRRHRDVRIGREQPGGDYWRYAHFSLDGTDHGDGLGARRGRSLPGNQGRNQPSASVAVSIAFSGFLVWLLPFHSATSEIVSRTNPNLLDLGIAFFSGLAGSVVVCRGGGDGVTALPGVAIAVALMPPLCVMGFGLGSGPNLEIMGGAGLLFLTNLVAIVASAFLVFLLVGMSDRGSSESDGRIPGRTRARRECCRAVPSRGCCPRAGTCVGAY